MHRFVREKMKARDTVVTWEIICQERRWFVATRVYMSIGMNKSYNAFAIEGSVPKSTCGNVENISWTKKRWFYKSFFLMMYWFWKWNKDFNIVALGVVVSYSENLISIIWEL